MVKKVFYILIIFSFGCAKKKVPPFIASENPFDKKCTMVHDIYHGITNLNTKFMFGSLDQKGKLLLVHNDYIHDTFPLHIYKPNMFKIINNWEYGFATEYIKTDSGVWYNAYNADTASLPDSMLKQSYFLYYNMVEAFYKMREIGP